MKIRKKFLAITTIIIMVVIAIGLWKLSNNNQELVDSNKSSENKAKDEQLLKKKTEDAPAYNDEDAKEYTKLALKILAESSSGSNNNERNSVAFKVRVIDQYGEPVVGAGYAITYTTGLDPKFNIYGSLNEKTDQDGMFDVAINKKISSVRIATSKIGYYFESGKSDKKISMANAQKLTENFSQEEREKWEKLQKSMGLPYNTLEKLLDEQGVVTLTLKKMSDYDKMYQNMFSFSAISSDPDETIPGKYMMEYKNHNAGGVVPQDAHVIQVGPIFYDKAKEKELNIRYSENRGGGKTPAAPWYSEMSIPGGGFYLIDEKEEPDGDLYQCRYAAEAKEGEEFLAPESGYVETVRAEMPESRMDETWRGAFTKNYYVKFPDNTYGRIKVVMGRGSYNITSWYNPTGRRNTEFCLDDDLDVKYIEK